MNGKGIPSPFGMFTPPPEMEEINGIIHRIHPDLERIVTLVRGNKGMSAFKIGVQQEGHKPAIFVLIDEEAEPMIPPDTRDDRMARNIMEAVGFLHQHDPRTMHPAEDLIQGIEKILREFFHDRAEDQNILGMLYSPFRACAEQVGKVLEAARIRDKESLARELDTLSKKLRYGNGKRNTEGNH